MSQALRQPPIRTESNPAVFIIDDDASVRRALERLLIVAGISSRSFGDAQEFLASGVDPEGACIVTDVKMPGLTGLELHRRLRQSGAHVNFIYVTAYDTEEARTQAKRYGAIAYFRKPVDNSALIDAIAWAMNRGEEAT